MNSTNDKSCKEINLNNEFSIKLIEDAKYGIAGEIWNSAFLLSNLMISKKCEKLMKNKTILEIGSGTGICGIFASLTGAKKVYLTDREENLDILFCNYELNKDQIKKKNCDILIKPLDWNYYPSFKNINDKIDLIIASDIIYHGLNFNKIIEMIKYFSLNNKINSIKGKTNDEKLENKLEIILAFTNRLGSSYEFFDILYEQKDDWKLKKLNYDFLNFENEIIEKIKYSELFSLQYLK